MNIELTTENDQHRRKEDMKEFNRRWVNLQNTFSPEIGKDLAEMFVRSLFNQSKGDIRRAMAIYFQIGIAWSALIVHWRNWILKKSSVKPPVLVMRDAKPLAALPISNSWPRVWLNRRVCGIKDEMSGNGDTKVHPFLERYLKQHSLDTPFTFVDSGCWGTIVRELHECLGMRFQPLFLFSHNPSIPGFLNELGIDAGHGEILNDSFECCFPNVVNRPSSLVEANGSGIIPKLEKTDFFSILLGKSVLSGVRMGAKIGDLTSPTKAAQHLLRLSDRAKSGEFTGILPQNAPTWSEGKNFLAQWPRELSWT